MPMRTLTPIGPAGRTAVPNHNSPSPHKSKPSSRRVIRSASASRPGPRAKSSSRVIPRRLCMNSIPSSGSIARSRIPAPVPANSLETLSIKCAPYTKYTYAWPCRRKSERLRGVGPRKAWQAASPTKYASVSTMRPLNRPCFNFRTIVLPIKKRASLTVSCGSCDRRSGRRWRPFNSFARASTIGFKNTCPTIPGQRAPRQNENSVPNQASQVNLSKFPSVRFLL
jgi:hypothetical protein